MGTLQFSRFIFFLLFFFFAVGFSDANLETKSSLIDNDNGNGTSSVTSNKLEGDTDLNMEKQGVVSQDVVVGDGVRSNMSELVGSKDGGGQEVSGFGSGLVEKEQDGADSKGGKLNLLMGIEKEKLRDEECDPSYTCVDETQNLTACLRVPGNDSPDLSLLIQNRGKKPVAVTITAPDFVQLEETKVQLQEKEDKKVKVSIIAYKGTDSVISLTATDTHCKLDLKELIRHDSKVEDTHHAFNLKNLSNTTRNYLIIFLALTAFLLLGCGWAYMSSHKKLLFGNGYKAMDVQLPVSVPVSTSDTNDGWDKSWDDGWDDEEAPITPTLPVTPNLSLRGLASRRLIKEAWKD